MSVGVDEVVVVEDVAAVDVLADKVLKYLADVRDDTRVWHFGTKGASLTGTEYNSRPWKARTTMHMGKQRETTFSRGTIIYPASSSPGY